MYPPAAPRPQGNNSLKILLIVLVVVLIPCIALIVFGLFAWRGMQGVLQHEIAPMASCAMRFGQARDAMLLYARDHDGKLPLAANWQDALEKYLAETTFEAKDVLGMKFEPLEVGADWGCRTPDGAMTGMAFNKMLAGKRVADIQNPRTTILLFEIEESQRNAAEKFAPRPKSTSPKMMGERRGWVTQPIEGDSNMGSDEGGLRLDANMKVKGSPTPEAKN